MEKKYRNYFFDLSKKGRHLSIITTLIRFLKNKKNIILKMSSNLLFHKTI